MSKIIKGVIGVVVIGVIVASIAFMGMFTVKSGHVAVGTLFGKVQNTVYTEGIHWENPLMNMKHFDVREKTMKVKMGVPSMDQLLTTFDISIQYKLMPNLVPSMLRETGDNAQAVIDTHMSPLFASKTREIGKSVATAEEFYEQAVQKRVQNELYTAMVPITSKGVKVNQLLIRNVVLPKIITDAVERKKLAAQNAEKAKELLKEFKVTQEQKDAEAQAVAKALKTEATGRLEAAKIDAQATLVTAEASAKAKRKQVNAVGAKTYERLELAKSLEKFQNGNHFIFSDGDTNNVLPFMNLTGK